MCKFYNNDNIFYKILNQKVVSNFLFSNENMIIIKDINPVAKIHLLAIPRLCCVDYSHFIEHAGKKLVNNFFSDINMYLKNNNIFQFQLLTNQGQSSGQVIFHFHIHIISNYECNIINK